MGGIGTVLSTISGHFGRVLVLGTMLPVVIFFAITGVLTVPLVTPVPLVARVLELDAEWQAGVVLTLIVVTTGLLYVLNDTIIRFYGGYQWQHSWIARFLTWRHRKRYLRATEHWHGLRTLQHARQKANLRPPAKLSREQELLDGLLEARRADFGQVVNGRYPPKPSSVMPTELGNLLRSFDNYPLRHYRMSTGSLWPRLAGVIDPAFAQSIDNEKVYFDFMINSSVLSVVVAASLVTAGLFGVLPIGGLRVLLLEGAVLATASYVAYRGAIVRAATWGRRMNAAFDLYRWKLLDQLGYRDIPTSVAQERNLWDNITKWMVFGDPPTGRLPDYKTSMLPFVVQPDGVRAELTRAVSYATKSSVEIELRIKNNDTRDIDAITINEQLPPGGMYVAGTAFRGADAIEVAGSNPYCLRVGKLSAGSDTLIRYQYRLLPSLRFGEGP